jgi:hypothetical protein
MEDEKLQEKLDKIIDLLEGIYEKLNEIQRGLVK